MTTVLAVVTFAALAAAVAVLVHRRPGPSGAGAFDTAAEEPERAPATYVALGRIQSLVRELPEEDAARELAALAGGEDRLREALR